MCVCVCVCVCVCGLVCLWFLVCLYLKFIKSGPFKLMIHKDFTYFR